MDGKNIVIKIKPMYKHLWLRQSTFIVNLCRNFFAISEKRVQNGPYINTFQISLKNVCLSVILEFWLSSELLYFYQIFTIQYCYVKMPDVTACYGMPLNFIRFFFEFCTKLTNIHVRSALFSPNIHKLCIWYQYEHFIIIKCQIWCYCELWIAV